MPQSLEQRLHVIRSNINACLHVSWNPGQKAPFAGWRESGVVETKEHAYATIYKKKGDPSRIPIELEWFRLNYLILAIATLSLK